MPEGPRVWRGGGDKLVVRDHIWTLTDLSKLFHGLADLLGLRYDQLDEATVNTALRLVQAEGVGESDLSSPTDSSKTSVPVHDEGNFF